MFEFAIGVPWFKSHILDISLWKLLYCNRVHLTRNATIDIRSMYINLYVAFVHCTRDQ